MPALGEALTDRLAALPKDEILDFDDCFHAVLQGAGSWKLCAACYLITGYVSDDTVDYFKRGLIALGRESFERVAADPDTLADEPVVNEIADGRLKRSVLVAEEFGWAAGHAYTRLSEGDDEAFWVALHARHGAPQADGQSFPRHARPHWDGRFGEPGDRGLIPIRLPRLTVVFPLSTQEQHRS